MRNKMAVILNYIQDDTQLRPLTQHRPIATLPIAGRYRLVDFIFSSMYNAEVVSGALFLSGSGHSLYDHVRSGSEWGLDSNVGGGLFTHSQVRLKLNDELSGEDHQQYYQNHRKYIDKTSAEQVLIAGGGLLFNVNLNALFQSHKENKTKISAVFKRLKRNELPQNTAVTALQFSEDEFVSGIEKIKTENETTVAANLKMVLVDKSLFKDFINYAEEHDLTIDADELMQYAFVETIEIASFEYTGYLKSIETIKDYYQANMDMLEEAKFNSLFYRNSPVITRIHHSAPTYYGKEANVTASLTASGGNIYGDVTRSVLFRKVTIGEGSTVSESIINSGSDIGKNVHLKHVVLDKDVTIDDNITLEGTADNPIIVQKGMHVTANVAETLGV